MELESVSKISGVARGQSHFKLNSDEARNRVVWPGWATVGKHSSGPDQQSMFQISPNSSQLTFLRNDPSKDVVVEIVDCRGGKLTTDKVRFQTHPSEHLVVPRGCAFKIVEGLRGLIRLNVFDFHRDFDTFLRWPLRDAHGYYLIEEPTVIKGPQAERLPDFFQALGCSRIIESFPKPIQLESSSSINGLAAVAAPVISDSNQTVMLGGYISVVYRELGSPFCYPHFGMHVAFRDQLTFWSKGTEESVLFRCRDLRRSSKTAHQEQLITAQMVSGGQARQLVIPPGVAHHPHASKGALDGLITINDGHPYGFCLPWSPLPPLGEEDVVNITSEATQEEFERNLVNTNTIPLPAWVRAHHYRAAVLKQRKQDSRAIASVYKTTDGKSVLITTKKKA